MHQTPIFRSASSPFRLSPQPTLVINNNSHPVPHKHAVLEIVTLPHLHSYHNVTQPKLPPHPSLLPLPLSHPNPNPSAFFPAPIFANRDCGFALQPSQSMHCPIKSPPISIRDTHFMKFFPLYALSFCVHGLNTASDGET